MPEQSSRIFISKCCTAFLLPVGGIREAFPGDKVIKFMSNAFFLYDKSGMGEPYIWYYGVIFHQDCFVELCLLG